MNLTQDELILKQSTKTELRKVGDPNRYGSMSRIAYYTNIRFSVSDKEIKMPMKINTGSAYTILILII